MKKVEDSSYLSIIPMIEKSPCGTVYPLSIAETKQYGDVYTQGDSVLLWHYSGFAFIYGSCENDFLEQIYQQFLSPKADLSRRFILFSADQRTIQFFKDKNELAFGSRYSYIYPKEIPVFTIELRPAYQIWEIDENLFENIQGRITPHFSWRDANEFISKGKGYCVLCNGEPASWAFSAAVSSDELDIGIETAEVFRHRGLGMIAAEKMIQYCFQHHKRPVWSCDTKNTASQKIAEKLGFIKTSEYTTIKRNN